MIITTQQGNSFFLFSKLALEDSNMQTMTITYMTPNKTQR